MARRRRASGKPIELFPFLAILACVIGVLTLMIAGLSMGELEIDRSGSDYVELTREIADEEARIDGLALRAPAGKRRGAMARHAREELARRAEMTKRTRELQREILALEAQIQTATAKRDELREGLELLQQELTLLESRLKGKRSERARGRRVELSGPRARAGQRRLEASFIECRTNEIVIHPDKSRLRQIVVPQGLIRTNGDLYSLGSHVKSSSRRTVILLVREGSVPTYDLLSGVLRSRSVRHGSLPVPGALKIDFSKFSEAGR